MTVEHLEIFVEEPSMEAALQTLLPRIFPTLSFSIYPFQCKDELIGRLPERMKGYASWLPPSWRILVLVDKDNDDCRELKHRLESIAGKANLKTRSRHRAGYAVVNRIVVEELEAWYFGDWNAVRRAFPRVPPTIPQQEKYRRPDAIQGGTWEAFERILQRAGYCPGGLAKIESARQIAAAMDPAANTSPSFQAFHTALRNLAEAD